MPHGTNRERRIRPDVVHVLPTAGLFGGTEQSVFDLLHSEELADVGQEFALVESGPPDPFPADRQIAVADRSLRRPLSVALAVARRRPTVIHGWLLKGNATAAMAHLLWPRSTLVTSERNLGHTLTRAKRLVERGVARLEDVCVANSEAVRTAADARIPGRARRTRVIYPGIRPPVRPTDTEPTSVVMVGRLHPVKDHVSALQAWARVTPGLAGATLTIVGDGQQAATLRALSQTLGIVDSVRFVGATDPAPYLFGAQIYLSTSRAEGFSRALLEAAMAGVPVVSTPVGGAAELAPQVVHPVVPGDVGQIAATLTRVLADPAAGEQARAMAPAIAQRYSPEACHRDYRELYRGSGVH